MLRALEDFRILMAMVAFVFLVYCWIMDNRKGFELSRSLQYVIFISLVLAAISYSKPLIFESSAQLDKFVGNETDKIRMFIDNLSRLGVARESMMDAFMPKVIGFILKAVRVLLWMTVESTNMLQSLILYCLYAFSPLMLAFLVNPMTRSVGIRYVMTTLSVILWPIGRLIAEYLFITVMGILSEKLSSVATSSVDLRSVLIKSIQNGTISYLAASAMIIGTLLLVIMYVLGPLIITLFMNSAVGGASGQMMQSAGTAAGSAVAGPAGGAVAKVGSKVGGMLGLGTSGKSGGGSGGGAAAAVTRGGSGAGGSFLGGGGGRSPMMGLSARQVQQARSSKSTA